MDRPLGKVLIANRGEIAVRIIRACREMGVYSVAVFSEADRSAMHVQLADEACEVGPPPASESYLKIPNVLLAAKLSGADAIHPGYGFLSENPEFAEAVLEAGLIWIGPPPSAIRSMGSKTEARAIMQKAGVPVVPGTAGGVESAEQAKEFIQEHGFPVLIKAAMGGGGKGMRIVREAAELGPALEAARRESLSAFGSPLVYLEKLIERPRHIEFQVFADEHGNVIHLGERECSIQRRHQKVVEESPSPIMTEELRQTMGESAVEAARAVGYVGAGTVEFLVDGESNYYFLEMNTRLQVEHPVTEMVTGVDLVQLQIEVAKGKPLPIKQEDVDFRGHAIEVRIYSEDVLNNFLPCTGHVRYLRPPDGFGIREDSGIREGDEISIHYDPMISKLIAWAPDRSTAIKRMRRALQEYRITGVRTTIPFGLLVMNNESFQRGEFDTSFVDREFDVDHLIARERSWQEIAAVAAAWRRHYLKAWSTVEHEFDSSSMNNNCPANWKKAGRRRVVR